MALKDWKKVENKIGKVVGAIIWDNKTNGRVILFYDKASKLYPVTLHIYNYQKHSIIFRKTKSQALKFAKAYMRSH